MSQYQLQIEIYKKCLLLNTKTLKRKSKKLANKLKLNHLSNLKLAK